MDLAVNKVNGLCETNQMDSVTASRIVPALNQSDGQYSAQRKMH